MLEIDAALLTSCVFDGQKSAKQFCLADYGAAIWCFVR